MGPPSPRDSVQQPQQTDGHRGTDKTIGPESCLTSALCHCPLTPGHPGNSRGCLLPLTLDLSSSTYNGPLPLPQPPRAPVVCAHSPVDTGRAKGGAVRGSCLWEGMCDARNRTRRSPHNAQPSASAWGTHTRRTRVRGEGTSKQWTSHLRLAARPWPGAASVQRPQEQRRPWRSRRPTGPRGAAHTRHASVHVFTQNPASPRILQSTQKPPLLRCSSDSQSPTGPTPATSRLMCPLTSTVSSMENVSAALRCPLGLPWVTTPRWWLSSRHKKTTSWPL